MMTSIKSPPDSQWTRHLGRPWLTRSRVTTTSHLLTSRGMLSVMVTVDGCCSPCWL